MDAFADARQLRRPHGGADDARERRNGLRIAA